MTALISKSIFNGIRSFTILLLIALLLPAGPASAQAAAQDPHPYARQQFGNRLDGQKQIVSATIAPSATGNLIQDPSFEASFLSTTYWEQFSVNDVPVCSVSGCGAANNATAKPRTGSNWVWFGGFDFSDPDWVSPEIADVYQNVMFPPAVCGATLQFYFWIGFAQPGSGANDYVLGAVDGNVVFSANATQQSLYPSYKLVSIDVSSFADGGVHQVEFYSQISDQLVNFNIDDVSLLSGECKAGVKGDYNGDGRKDVAVFRPSTSTWHIGGIGAFSYGQSGDTPVPADYNGDGRTDIAVFRPSTSTWHIGGIGAFPYGQSGDIPVVADYNGDGRADIAVFRPSTSTWHIGGIGAFPYGQSGDIPVVADYNGDGRADIAVFRPSTSMWHIGGIGAFPYGQSGDIPVVADYNGDGRADIAVFRPSNGTWYIGGIGSFRYGQSGDVPVPGDYNGDGRAEIAVFRPSNGTWYISGIGPRPFGTVGDIPV